MLKNNNQGAASLITVIFVSIILSIVVIGFVRVALDETRQSTDDDLATRAFYAAESGIEDAKRALKDYAKGNITLAELNVNDCNPPAPGSVPYDTELSGPDEFDNEYTCMLIDMSPPDYKAVLSAGETKQIELRAASNFNNVLVEWHVNANPPDGDGANPIPRSSSSLPTIDQWDTSIAMLRAHLFSYPNGSFNRSSLDNKSTVVFLNPRQGATSGAINYISNPERNLDVRDVGCSAVSLNDYVCSQTFRFVDNLGNSVGNNANHILRLTSLYEPTSIKVTLLNGVNVVSFSGTQAIVDVTGRAADVYRRIETRVNLESAFSNLLPEYGIISGDDVCKNLIIPEAVSASQFRANNCSINQ